MTKESLTKSKVAKDITKLYQEFVVDYIQLGRLSGEEYSPPSLNDFIVYLVRNYD